jgi:DNA primase
MASPVEQIKEKLDLVELIQSYVRLQKAGANYKALCPFHKEKTPSFIVSAGRQIWHCFGCQKGGDHFRFIMEHEGVEFPEALRILAKMTGVELRREDVRLKNERIKIGEILEKAKEFYKKNLAKRSDVLDYLRERGLQEKTIADFELGYAEPGWDNLYQLFRQSGYSNDDLEKTGLVIRRSSPETGSGHLSGFYDRFRGRVMFPIFDSMGGIIGFSGRVFEKDLLRAGGRGPEAAPAKYINTPNTVLYDKSKVLYGFHKAKDEIRRKNSCIFVEGQMDVLMSHQAGVTNVVGISGTAVTEFHLVKIKRLAGNLLFALDPDNAGLQATKRGLDTALSRGFEIKIVPLANDDPADIVKKDKTLWPELVKKAKPVISYYLNFLMEKIKDERELALAVSRIVIPYIAVIENRLDQNHWVKETAKVLKIKEEPIWEEIAKRRKTIAKNGASSDAVEDAAENAFFTDSRLKSRRDLLEERLIGLVLWRNELAQKCEKGWEDYFSSARRNLFSKALLGGLSFEEHYPQKLALEAELCYGEIYDLEKEIKKIFSELKRERIKEEMEILSRKISEAEASGDSDALEASLKDFHKISKELNSHI